MTVLSVSGRHFWKMSGSGNDFVFFDARLESAGPLENQDVVARICSRGTGVGADGIVFLQVDDSEAFRIRYLNRDGSLGELCGNASLCSVRLAVELGLAHPSGFCFATDAGVIAGRLVGTEPEIDLQPLQTVQPEADIELQPNESRIGYVVVGVPHLVVLTSDLSSVDVVGRGRALRRHPTLAGGANVNFVAPERGGAWLIRTYERGVEAETLACGTGSVATAALLVEWGLGSAATSVQTKSGRTLTVTMRREAGALRASLRGEGRIVFEGDLRDA
jgi:diaminopimelate epimerase